LYSKPQLNNLERKRPLYFYCYNRRYDVGRK